MAITLSPIRDFAALEARWQALERNADPSAFLTSTVLFCQAATRFAGAALLSVTDSEGDVVLALIGNRRLNETGDPEQDSLFIEHNNLLIRRGAANAAIPALRYALRHLGVLTLSGVGAPLLAEARQAGWAGPIITRPAPFATLPPNARTAQEALPKASANLRAQLARSLRLYGPDIALARAYSTEEAQRWFGELVSLHQARWTARGKPGAFASPVMQAFHTTLIGRGHLTGIVDLLRIATPSRVIGLLYLLTQNGRALAYQSGLAFGADQREKPGLVCHALAMAHYASRGFAIYDFLAGDARYKRSLSTDCEPLHWTTLHRPWSPAGCLALLRRGIQPEHDV